jgi:hypothetical protein
MRIYKTLIPLDGFPPGTTIKSRHGIIMAEKGSSVDEVVGRNNTAFGFDLLDANKFIAVEKEEQK